MAKPRSKKKIPTERRQLNQALAKALAYKQAGNMELARDWAIHLVSLLWQNDLLPSPQELANKLLWQSTGK